MPVVVPVEFKLTKDSIKDYNNTLQKSVYYLSVAHAVGDVNLNKEKTMKNKVKDFFIRRGIQSGYSGKEKTLFVQGANVTQALIDLEQETGNTHFGFHIKEVKLLRPWYITVIGQ